MDVGMRKETLIIYKIFFSITLNIRNTIDYYATLHMC